MTTVQLAISNTGYARALRDLLSDGEHNVVVVDKPDLTLPGLIVVEAGLLGDLLNSADPARFVVITTPETDVLSRLWGAGFHGIVFAQDSPRLAYMAILGAELRFFGKLRPEMTSLPLVREGAMDQPGLRGPFTLSDSAIDDEVTRKSAGVYTLEDSDSVGCFHVVYVGRSERDVNNQLHVHVGTHQRFKYAYCSSAQGAFEQECSLYHDFDPKENWEHPDRPKGTEWKCPGCSLFS
jgi:hypothetical protein